MKIENKKYLYYAAIFIFVLIVFGIYFCMFHGNLSDDSYIWANFGNYINGFLSPLLTIINIIVFIELTLAISTLEEHRSEKTLENEKKLLLMQLRKQELDIFVKQTNRIYDGHTIEERVETLRQVSDYLSSFGKTGFKWFSIEDKNQTKRKLDFLVVSLRTLQYNMEADVKSPKEVYEKISDLTEEITNTLLEAALKNNITLN